MSFGEHFGLVVVIGATVGVTFTLPWSDVLALTMVVVAVMSGIGWKGRWWRAAAWMMLAGLSIVHGARARDQVMAPAQAFDGLVTIDGTLRRDASPGDSGVRLEVDAGGVRALVYVSGESAASYMSVWTAGRRVRMPARLREPSVTRNPGSPTVRWQRLVQPFDQVGTVKSGALVEVWPAAAWQEAAAAVRRHVRAVTERRIAPIDRQTAAVVTAILIGDRAGLDESAMRRLQVAGTFHVIAISGGNVAMLTALCLFVLQAIVRREWIAVSTTLVVVLAYGAVVGNDASVVRAVLAASLYLVLRLAGLEPRPVNVLAMTAVLCVLVNPLVVVDVGAWLSFGATLGLITVLPLLMALGRPSANVVWRIIRASALATIAAEIVILPISASVFMRVGVAGLLLNFVAIPAMALVQLAGFVLCVVDWWWPGLAPAVAAAAHASTTVLIGSSSLVELAPWLSWRVPPPALGWVLAYYLMVVLAMSWRGERAVTWTAVLAASVSAVVIASSPATVWRQPARGWLRVTMLDVGQGEAIAAQTPSGHVLLVDAGGTTGRFDVGGRVVTPALWALGIRQIDYLAVTHGDIDHVGGARRVIDDIGVREVWEGIPVVLHPPMVALRLGAHDGDVAWRRLQAGHQMELGAVLVDVLHPGRPDWERPRVRNDDSLVLRLRYGRVELLLTGDAGPEFESAFIRDSGSPPIRILKVAHHGSRTSSSEAFLDAYRPSVALVSAGQHNLFGHPTPAVLGRLDARDVTVFRSDRDGATIIETDGREARVRSWSGRTLRVTSVPSRVATRPPSARLWLHAPTTLAAQDPLQAR